MCAVNVFFGTILIKNLERGITTNQLQEVFEHEKTFSSHPPTPVDGGTGQRIAMQFPAETEVDSDDDDELPEGWIKHGRQWINLKTGFTTNQIRDVFEQTF
jgi:hypothetical protein